MQRGRTAIKEHETCALREGDGAGGGADHVLRGSAWCLRSIASIISRMLRKARSERDDAQRAPTWRAIRAGLVVAGAVAAALGPYLAVATARRVPTVQRPSTAAERAAGIVRGRATFHAEGPIPVPPCMAKFERGEDTVTSHFNGDSRVEFDDGARYVLPESSSVEFFEQEPPSGVASKEAIAYERKKKPDVSEFKLMACLGPETHVWVESCARGQSLYGCPESDGHVLITPGGAVARAQSVTSRALGWVALALAGACIACAAFAQAFAAPSVALNALAGRRHLEAYVASGAAAIGAAAIGAALGAVAWSQSSAPWIVGATASIIPLSLVGLCAARVRALLAARRVLRACESARLRERGSGGRRAFAARVAADAPTFPGFLAGVRHALVRFRLLETVRDDGSESTRTVAVGVTPNELLIEDDSASAALLLAHANLDLPEEPRVDALDPAELPPWFADVAGPFSAAPSHVRFSMEWSALDPGDPLVVFGTMEGAPRPGADAPNIYRDRPEVRRIGGDAGAPALAHLGEHAPLARAVARDLAASVFALAAMCTSVAGAVALAGWVLRQ